MIARLKLSSKWSFLWRKNGFTEALMVLFSRESESQWITLRLEEDYKKNQKKKKKQKERKKERERERERERVNRKLESNL